MQLARHLFSILLLGCASVALAQDINIARFDVLSTDSFSVNRTAGSTNVEFAASGQIWQLNLQPNTRLAQQLPASTSTVLYRGNLGTVKGSWVRVSERDGIFQGVIYDGDQYYALERNRAGALTFYALKDAIVAPGTMSCGVSGPSAFDISNLQVRAEAVAAEIQAAVAAVPTQSIDIIMVGDSFFQTENAGDPSGALMDRVNVVDGIYSDQVGVTLNVTEFRLTDAATEPFTTNDAEDLLDEVADYKDAEAVTRNAGLLHLYTGRNLDGTTAGIAFSGGGVLCNTKFGAGLSEGRRNLSLDSLIAAHEFGHNFGAPHDGDPDRACAAEPDNVFIMAPAVNNTIANNAEFSACSLNQMQQQIAVAACITAIEPIDVLPVLRGFPVDVAISDTFNGTVDVTNNGSGQADNVELAVSVPAGLQLDQTALPAGCTTAGTGANCGVGTIAASGTQSLTFNFSALAAGNSDLEFTTTTPNDDNTANDNATATIVVEAPIDLSASIASDANFVIGENETITIGIVNNSGETATNPQVQLNASTFLSVESVPNNCVANGTVVTCQAASVAGNSTSTFDITVAGGQVGNTIIRATVSGGQPDPNTANDEVTQSISVANPAPASVDMTLALSGASSLDDGATGTYTIDVSNAGNADANAVTLDLTFPSTLRANSTDNANCTVVTGGLDCDFGNVTAASSIQISMEVLALNAGNGNIEATLNTASTDTNSANNTATLAVTVNAPPSTGGGGTTGGGNTGGGSSSGGGGGAVSWLALGLLTLIGRRRRLPR